ncbi:serine hydrolase domain-containing protein [Sphingomonas asaccharolytica]|uniref:serine hydrolase domain-containing protein n=1 Tax=Sphingomonas asaccharolytica TaxID=40681 RepID=UPI0008366F19|nr:serine hydrolase domain-containing protein [Sphingomonas asaccharolytica]
MRLAAAILAVTAFTATPADAKGMAAAARRAMAETQANGLAIAVIDHGRVVSVEAFGKRNAKGDPLTVDTVMYGASITKAVFGYLVMQLADEGKADLDRPIAAMLPRPIPDYGNLDAYGNWGDLTGDDRWRAITPRMAMTHSTGFANFSFLEPDRKLRIHFDPGTHFSYSGEGIMLLQFGLEQGLGLNVGAELQRRFFGPLGMTRTGLMWRPDFAANLADGWTSDGKVEPHDERSKVRVAGSMDTTITDLAKFAAYMVRGGGLSRAAAAERVRGSLPITTATQFPNFLPDAPADKRVPGLAAGIGVIAFTGPQGPGWFKGGHNEATGNTLVCVERRERCVLILANDVRAERAFPMLVKAALGETGAPFGWEYGDYAGR